MIEAQRRIHELEAQREQEQQVEGPRTEEPRSEPAPSPVFREEVREEAPREEVRAAPPAPQPEAPRIDPKELLDSAGLVMIETDRSKAAPAAPAEEPVQLGRPRRERAKPAAEEETLQQVETKR